jgi:hypothetical protein
MCVRYVSPDEASIEREFNLVHQEWQFPSSFNVAPTQQVAILREIDGEHCGSIVRWGLIPADEPSVRQTIPDWANGNHPDLFLLVGAPVLVSAGTHDQMYTGSRASSLPALMSHWLMQPAISSMLEPSSLRISSSEADE